MEIKVNNEPISVNCRSFPLAVTAILSKHKAVSVDKTLPGHPDPNSVEDRIMTPDFDRYHVIGTCCRCWARFESRPSARRNSGAIASRPTFVTWTRKIVVVWADDLNAAPLAIGAETTAFANISSPPGKEAGRFVDIWRKTSPNRPPLHLFSARYTVLTTAQFFFLKPPSSPVDARGTTSRSRLLSNATQATPASSINNDAPDCVEILWSTHRSNYWPLCTVVLTIDVGAMSTSREGERVFEALRVLATKLRTKRGFTNVVTFDLRCDNLWLMTLVPGVCAGNKEEKEARAHESETGLVKSGEYRDIPLF
ncbi:hypothetical protein BC826DRAFT_1175833 [Russula brevipes]|nr:hypothetical protein BC826DRAFT_1175833 [Russula brevipes]